MPKPIERYTIRRQFFKFLGAAFHVYDEQGTLAGYCKQKAFKLREDIRLFTDESQSTPLLTLKARNIIDFSATYDVLLPSGQPLGSLRRKGMMSTFVRDEWTIFNTQAQPIATIREEGGFLTVIRRIIEIAATLFPQQFTVTTNDGQAIATFRQHFNPFIYRLGVAIHQPDEQLDDLMLLGAACLLAAIEGRQN